MKRREYTKRDFIVSLLLTVLFTLLYFVIYFILPWLENYIEFSEATVITVYFGYLFLPIIILLAWFMCLERYIYLEFRVVDKRYMVESRIKIYVSMAVMMLLGIGFCIYFMIALSFIIEHWAYIEALYGYATILLAILLGWLCSWIYSIRCIKEKRIIGVKDGLSKKQVIAGALGLALLIGISVIVTVYVYEQAFTIRLVEMLKILDTEGRISSLEIQ